MKIEDLKTRTYNKLKKELLQELNEKVFGKGSTLPYSDFISTNDNLIENLKDMIIKEIKLRVLDKKFEITRAEIKKYVKLEVVSLINSEVRLEEYLLTNLKKIESNILSSLEEKIQERAILAFNNCLNETKLQPYLDNVKKEMKKNLSSVANKIVWDEWRNLLSQIQGR